MHDDGRLCAAGAADWYVDDDGMLYIAPCDDAEISGPDSAIRNEMVIFWRHFGRNPRPEEAEAMGLGYVYAPTRRWNDEDGYYYA